MKYYHIQLTEGSEFITELGWSLTEVMLHLTGSFDEPYSYLTTPSDIGFRY